MQVMKAVIVKNLDRLGFVLAKKSTTHRLHQTIETQEVELVRQRQEIGMLQAEIVQLSSSLAKHGFGDSSAFPDNQAITDVLRGLWYSEFPEGYMVQTGGRTAHFDFAVDPRVKWASEQLQGGLADKRILELGPFEAYNTWQMEQLGATDITVIEANQLNFLKCLLVKEVTRLRARFRVGDFVKYLASCAETYDLIWASGVLYHLVEPINFVRHVSRCTNRVFLSTHYYDEDVIGANNDLLHHFDRDKDSIEEVSGFSAHRYYRDYREVKAPISASGRESYSYWLDKETILGCLRYFGFTRIIPGVDHPLSPNGPAMWFLAEKPGGLSYLPDYRLRKLAESKSN